MWKRFDKDVKRTTHMFQGIFIETFDNDIPSDHPLNFASSVVTTSAIKESLLKALDKGSQVSINFTKKHLIPSENNMPLKGYYDPLPKSNIKVMTEIQKAVRIQFNSVTLFLLVCSRMTDRRWHALSQLHAQAGKLTG